MILVGGMSVAPTAVGIIANVARSGGAAVAAASDGGKVLGVGIAATLSAAGSIGRSRALSLFAGGPPETPELVLVGLRLQAVPQVVGR